MIIDAPDLKISGFWLWPFNPGDEVIENPNTGKRIVYRRSHGSWQGAIKYGTLDPNRDIFRQNRKELLGFHNSLDGFVNTVSLLLPDDYKNTQEINPNVVFAVTATSEAEITIGLSIAGFVPKKYDYFNSGNRLFMIKAIDENNPLKVTVYPAGILKPNDKLTFNNLFVRARLDGTTQIGRNGRQLISHTFAFWEDLN